MRSTILAAAACGGIVIGSYAAVSAQPAPKPAAAATVSSASSTPAFAEVLLRRTEYESELESLLLDYTEEYPRVKELRYALGQVRDTESKLLAVKPDDQQRLTLALGKLLVRRIELEVDLWRLRQTYAASSPDVRRAARRLEIYDRAIRQILP
ncbi:MAG: hypothetical protein ACK4S4_08490 [Pyrinomonadaceae bacterium]